MEWNGCSLQGPDQFNVACYTPEVSSKDYLVTSDKLAHLLFESWFRNSLPQKKKNYGKKGSEKDFN